MISQIYLAHLDLIVDSHWKTDYIFPQRAITDCRQESFGEFPYTYEEVMGGVCLTVN